MEPNTIIYIGLAAIAIILIGTVLLVGLIIRKPIKDSNKIKKKKILFLSKI